MTIALRVAGAATSTTAAVTAVSPAVGAGAAGSDLSVLCVACKPYTTTLTTPANWTKLGETTNGTVASAADVGSTKVALYYRVGAPVGAIGNIAQTGADTMVAQITTYSTSAGGWDTAAIGSGFTAGGDTTNGANYSATGAASIGVTAGDWVYSGTAVNTDLGTPTAIAIGGLAGATMGTLATRSTGLVSTGNDARLVVVDRPVTAGTSTTAPTLTYTNASNSSGSTMWVRLREAPLPKAETLVDEFTTKDTTKWTWGSTAGVTGGRASFTSIQAGTAWMESTSRYDLVNSSVVCYVPTYAGSTAVGSLSLELRLATSANSRTAATYLALIADPGAVGVLEARASTSGNATFLVNDVDLSLSTHLWWRFRCDGTSVFWEASTDGVTYTTFLTYLLSSLTPWTPTGLMVAFNGFSDDVHTGAFEVEHVNGGGVEPPAAVVFRRPGKRVW